MSNFVYNLLGRPDMSSDQDIMTIESILENRNKSGINRMDLLSVGAEDAKIRRKNNRKIELQFEEMSQSTATAFIPFENEAVQFWKIFFDFAFYFLLSPFRFIWNPDTGFYECHTSKIQRSLQWIFCLFTSIYFVFKLHQMSGMDPDENPTLFFDMAYYFFDTTVLVIIFLTFGNKKPLVDCVFQELQLNNRKYYFEAVNYKKTRRLCALILFGCLGTLGLQILETFLDQNWDLDQFIAFWKNDAAAVFHDHSLTKALPWFFGGLALASSLFEKLLNAFSDILFTMTVLMFNNLVNSFEADMKKAKKLKEAEASYRVLDHFWWIKYITSKINIAMNLITGAFIAGNLPFFASNVFEVFGDGNVFMRIRYIFYCAYWFPSLFIAANANHKIEKVKALVCQEQHYANIPPVKLQVFLHEVDFFPVGLSSYGVITVTWNTVESIISIICTYALLKSQFKSETKIADTDFGDVLKEIQKNITIVTNIMT